MKLRVATCGELKHQTFVHYGSSEFIKEKCRPIDGYASFDKPKGGYWCCKNSKGNKEQWKEYVENGYSSEKIDYKQYLADDKRSFKNVKSKLKELKSELKHLDEISKNYDIFSDDFTSNLTKRVQLDKEVKKYEKLVKDYRGRVKGTAKSVANQEKKDKAMQSKHYIKIKPGAKILKIRTEEDYIEMVKQFPHEDAILAKLEQLKGAPDYLRDAYNPSVVINFENLSKSFDGLIIEKELLDTLKEKYSERKNGHPQEIMINVRGENVDISKMMTGMAGWDVSSMVIFNPDVISKATDKVESYNKK